MSRPSWDEFWVTIATKTADLRATCKRLRVGCLLVRGNILLGLGYNGAPRGLPHCEEEGIGCDMEGGHCVRAEHAESNAVTNAQGSTEGATCYTTAFPCWPCFRRLMNAGVVRVVYARAYRVDPRVTDAAQRAGIDLVQVAPVLSRAESEAEQLVRAVNAVLALVEARPDEDVVTAVTRALTPKVERHFPLLLSYEERRAWRGPLSVPWHIAEQAHVTYRRQGHSQPLEQVADRGGFGPEEMDTYLPSWRARVGAPPLIVAPTK